MKMLITILLNLYLFLSASPIFADATTSAGPPPPAGNVENEAPNTKTTITTTTTTNINTTSAHNDNDDKIVSAIYTKYAKDPALTGTQITVTSQNGIVTLNGTVTGQAQADEAVIAAKSVNGVKDVRSAILVTTNPPKTPTRIPNY